MAKFISRNLTVTRVSYCVVEVQDKVPVFVPRTDAVFRGIIESRERIMKLLKAREGKEANIVVTDVHAGSNRYTISLEDFVLNASIVEDATGADEDEDGPSGEESPEGPGDNEEEASAEQDDGDASDDKEDTDDGETASGKQESESGGEAPAAATSAADDHAGIAKASQPKPWY